MLSYRHSFHAGNFADVLKHLVLIKILEHLNTKEKPFCCIDTHAGAGGYLLESDYAQKNKEFNNGIGTLWSLANLPEAVAQYVKVIKSFNVDDTLTTYPGSPLLIQNFLRQQDHLFAHELHPSDIELLKQSIRNDRRVTVHHTDGLKNTLGLLPPKANRGLVLIDPSYEIKSDYETVLQAVFKFYKRFAHGTFALWYPVVDRARNIALEKSIKDSPLKNVHLYELGIKADTLEHGMTANGMIVINPPWKLTEELQTCLPYLADTLGVDGQGYYRIETLVAE